MVILSSFTERVITAIGAIPPGRVATYGQIAAFAGNKRAARQVVRILHACSGSHGLPWHRVVNREGRITMPNPHDVQEQRIALMEEGVNVDEAGRIDLEAFLWQPMFE